MFDLYDAFMTMQQAVCNNGGYDEEDYNTYENAIVINDNENVHDERSLYTTKSLKEMTNGGYNLVIMLHNLTKYTSDIHSKAPRTS